MRPRDERASVELLPANRALKRRRLAGRELNRTRIEYVQLLRSLARREETVRRPAFAVTRTLPEHAPAPRSVPRARNEYGPRRSRVGLSRIDSELGRKRVTSTGRGTLVVWLAPSTATAIKRVATDVRPARPVHARERRCQCLADQPVVVEELHLGDPTVIGGVDSQRRRDVPAEAHAGRGRAPCDCRRTVVGAAVDDLDRRALAGRRDRVERVDDRDVVAGQHRHAIRPAVASVNRCRRPDRLTSKSAPSPPTIVPAAVDVSTLPPASPDDRHRRRSHRASADTSSTSA